MKKYLWVFIFLLSAGIAFAESKLSVSGYIANENSLRFNNFNNDLTKEKNIFQIAAEYKISDEWAWFGKAKYWYDAAYGARDKMDIGQHYNSHVQRTDWLRDCYLDYNQGSWFLRLGKQQVAWGQADGITILDRVNPVDLTEYWLPDITDIRIPLWMANINYSPKLNANLQLLCIPDFEQSEAAYVGGPFTFRSFSEFNSFMKNQQAAGCTWDVQLRSPPTSPGDSTWGLQWSDRAGDLNYTLNYLYGHYYNARNNIYTSRINPLAPYPVKYIVYRSFKVWRIYGGSFNKTFTKPGPLQGITLRGDFAYYNDEPTYFGNPDIASTKGFKRWDNKFWLIGVDRYVFTKWLVSFQFAQYILEHAKVGAITAQNVYPMNAYTYGPMDQVENIFSLKFSSSFMNDRLKPEFSWSTTDDRQGKISPKINYEIRNNLVLSVGVHYFYGNPFDTNGQFRNEDQFYVNMKYSF